VTAPNLLILPAGYSPIMIPRWRRSGGARGPRIAFDPTIVEAFVSEDVFARLISRDLGFKAGVAPAARIDRLTALPTRI